MQSASAIIAHDQSLPQKTRRTKASEIVVCF